LPLTILQSHIQGNPGDHRLPRLGTHSPLDKRITYGGIYGPVSIL
jgi:hypothetical protein